MKIQTLTVIAIFILSLVACSQQEEKASEDKTDLSGVVESKIIESALEYQKAGGKAEFMEGEPLSVTDENYGHAETAKNYRN